MARRRGVGKAGIDRWAENTSLRYPSVRCTTLPRDRLGKISAASSIGNLLASGEQERGTIVKRTETFRSGPEGSTPSRQRPASRPEASLARLAATPRVKRRSAG